MLQPIVVSTRAPRLDAVCIRTKIKCACCRMWIDPYLVGNYDIAAISVKRQEHIANARELLARLAHNEGSTTYWNLEANTTSFYGWGTAGRLETTALAVEALSKLEELGGD